jgi:NAD(P)-dependent dehydrogenase (short-subunit alcohol dehydrogenase family)
MELRDQTILLLGGAGLVGQTVARRMLDFSPKCLVIASLRQEEAEEAAAALALDARAEGVELVPTWGDLFVPAESSRRERREVLLDDEARARFIQDLYGELTPEVFERSALGALLLEVAPDVVVDSVNTAGALAYQDAFRSAGRLRKLAEAGDVDRAAVEAHLSTLYLPQLIRHTQIALEGMKRVGTQMYVKVGTAGTGGMGLNIPFTHAEERPSRVLLAKAGLAGAQSLLLFLMSRTPGAPAVKEIKPTAAISWKSLGYGVITRSGRPVLRGDALRPLPLDEALTGSPASAEGDDPAWVALEEALTGVFVDSGENGLFAPSEFETLTALGLMEFVTPEEIAENVIREIRGIPSGKDIVAALDGATMGPTYRAGILRGQALERMEALEAKYRVEGVAYEMLGPPRLSKLLFEAAILGRLFGTLESAEGLDPETTARRAHELVSADDDLRQRIVSIGLPLLLPDGQSMLRGPRLKVAPEEGESVTAQVLVDRGWVDLRPQNWTVWKERIRGYRAELGRRPALDLGSRGDHEYGEASGRIRPGRLGAWIFRYEDEGERIKR